MSDWMRGSFRSCILVSNDIFESAAVVIFMGYLRINVGFCLLYR